MMTRIFNATGFLFLGLLVAAASIWGSLALLYAAPAGMAWAAVYGFLSLLTLVALCLRRWRWRVLAA